MEQLTHLETSCCAQACMACLQQGNQTDRSLCLGHHTHATNSHERPSIMLSSYTVYAREVHYDSSKGVELLPTTLWARVLLDSGSRRWGMKCVLQSFYTKSTQTKTKKGTTCKSLFIHNALSNVRIRFPTIKKHHATTAPQDEIEAG